MRYLLLAILLFAIYASGQLSLDDWQQKNVCPKILGIPACYIVFTLFIIGTASHLFSFSFNRNLFFIAIGIIALIALFGTVSEIAGKQICPRTSNGTPMCYYSLALSFSLILLKFLDKSQAIFNGTN